MKAKVMKNPTQDQFSVWLASQPGNDDDYTDVDYLMGTLWAVLRSEAVRLSILAEIAETEVEA